MKFAATTLFAATAAAISVQRHSESPVYEVSDFVADCESELCLYSFNLIRYGDGETGSYLCRAEEPSVDGRLPEVRGGLCAQTSLTFDVSHNNQGIEISISAAISPISINIGVHLILDAELDFFTGLNHGDYEVYRGPKEFKLFTTTS
ncbi:hypothetical protein MN608_10839 [Microdochium nivale]|nr:hypothetical protein MN608_10839 [Microdochium nivale]